MYWGHFVSLYIICAAAHRLLYIVESLTIKSAEIRCINIRDGGNTVRFATASQVSIVIYKHSFDIRRETRAAPLTYL